MANYVDKNAGDPWLAADGNALADDIGDPTTGHQHDGTAGHATLLPDAIGDGASITWDGRVLFDKGGDLDSGSTVTPGTDGNYFDITGTTTITALATLQAGTVVIFQFDAAVLLTHNGTSLILADSSNYTTAAGDVFAFISEGSGNWRELFRRLATTLGVANNCRIATGTYTGNDGTSQEITGIGFQVKWIWISAKLTDNQTFGDRQHIWTSDVIIDDDASGLAISVYVTTVITDDDAIIELTSDGFKIDDDGTDDDPNKNAVDYNYVVLG